MNKDTLKDIMLLLLGGVLAITGFFLLTHTLLSINRQASIDRQQRTMYATVTDVESDGTTQLTDTTGNVWVIIDDGYQQDEHVKIVFNIMDTQQIEDDEIVSVSRS